MTLQRPVKVMDWDPGEANCLCGKFIGGCRCLRSTRPPGGWNAWNARRARPLQLNAPVPGPCSLLRWMDAWAPFEGGQAEHTVEKLSSLKRGRKLSPPPPPASGLPPPADTLARTLPERAHQGWSLHSRAYGVLRKLPQCRSSRPILQMRKLRLLEE